jgi:adenine phosphoribosyltransferase
MSAEFKNFVRTFPDFPTPGTLFYDIAPLLANGQAWHNAIDRLSEKILVFNPDMLIGIESRGFLLAAPLAYRLACGFAMVRKSGKLPGETRSVSYELEYGNGNIEGQIDAVKPGQRVVILDDILATGGTANAAITLARELGAKVEGCAFLIELSGLKGRQKLDVPYYSLMNF